MDGEFDEDLDLPYTRLSIGADELKVDEESSITGSRNTNSSSAWSRFCTMWTQRGCRSKKSVIDDSVQETACIRLCMARIIDSDVLTEDDAAFLTNVFGERPSVDELTEVDVFRRRGLETRWLHRAVALMSYAACRCSMSTMLSQAVRRTVDGFVVIALVATALTEFTVKYTSRRIVQLQRRGLDSTKSFLDVCSIFLSYLKKSIKFLHEIEVIGRGFLLTVSGSSLYALEHSNLMKGFSSLPESCRCDGLRITLLRSVRQVIAVFRTATRELLNKCPLRSDVDREAHYVAFIDNEEFGPLMVASFEDEAELTRVTDDLSISAIKVLR